MAKQPKRITGLDRRPQQSSIRSPRRSSWSRPTPTAKFDESVEIAVNLGVDPRHADQNVRGVVTLPSGTGRDVRVAVIAKDAKADEATAAGADIVGAEDLVERIQGGFMEFDRVIATPDMMALVGRLGKVLGPRGLMPNPRVGTVTPNVGQAVKDAKGGSIEFRVEKAGIVHAGVGKASFTEEALAGQRQGPGRRAEPRQAVRAPRAPTSSGSSSPRPWAPASRSSPAASGLSACSSPAPQSAGEERPSAHRLRHEERGVLRIQSSANSSSGMKPIAW